MDHLEADGLVHLGQRGIVEILSHEADKSLALLGRQIAEDLAKFRLVQAADRVAQVDRVVVGQRLADTLHERVKDIALFIVDAGCDRGFALGDFLHVALGQRHPL